MALGVGIGGTVSAIFYPSFFTTAVATATAGVVGLTTGVIPFLGGLAFKNRDKPPRSDKFAGQIIVFPMMGGALIGAINALTVLGTAIYSAATSHPGALELLMIGFQSKFLIGLNIVAMIASLSAG
eukprot:CAMPEP_0201541136 /NCGR_PEP_ID=MMETSP0161_2-20130828/71312_1 /ASSEMBLY_ACC=CAM_ASM_000251 /TAXON_ID=180227 /ORGANISM="Neoparamoeba aestuarina, Strain SoJaBio B1-5/56/2" /LENGTH=125 /DNA_ID=CAMNT_0047948649 /DNA_START=983 /DNA_END=1356 /DNA_ORIENTATION=+